MVFQVTVNAMDTRYYVDIPSRHVFFIWHMYMSYLFSTLSVISLVLSGPLPSR